VRETLVRRAALPLAVLALVALAVAATRTSSPRPIDEASMASSLPAPAASAAPLTFVGAEHILVAYAGALDAAKTVTRTRVDAKLRADEARALLIAEPGSFAALVATYSDDAITRPSGGKIGNFERNVFPAAFSDAAFGMAVGGISDVVETPRGFHVIVRTQ
jgi:hypothetical protein